MAVFYLDTSALVKRYAQEDGTARIADLTDPTAGHDLCIVWVTGPEVTSALFRKARTGGISFGDAVRSTRNFNTDWQKILKDRGAKNEVRIIVSDVHGTCILSWRSPGWRV